MLVLARFFVTMSIYVAAMVGAFFAFRFFLGFFVWQPHDPWFQFFSFFQRNAIPLFLLGSFLGFVVIFAIYWRRTLKFIDDVVRASEVLASPDDQLVQLPVELRDVELRMNQVKQTALKNARQAKEGEQRKNDMVMYLAHDIKTPLTSVIGYLSLLDEVPDMPLEQKAKYTSITLEKARRLERLIDEFFEITRYNFQTIVLNKEHIDLHYMLVQMADEFEPLLAADGKEFVLLAPENLELVADRDKLARVFNNILKNAVAYSPKNSTIHITAAAANGEISIEFKNQGNIPEDMLSLIFEKFYRLDGARSSNGGGAGLGLAIAKEIVQSHGGSVSAKSSDGFISFLVTFPVFIKS